MFTPQSVTKMIQSTNISSVTCTQNWELPGVLSVTPWTLWWRKNDAREKSTQLGNELTKQVLAMMSKQSHLIKSTSNQRHFQSQNVSCGSCSFNPLQAHKTSSLGRIVPLTFMILVLVKNIVSDTNRDRTGCKTVTFRRRTHTGSVSYLIFNTQPNEGFTSRWTLKNKRNKNLNFSTTKNEQEKNCSKDFPP